MSSIMSLPASRTTITFPANNRDIVQGIIQKLRHLTFNVITRPFCTKKRESGAEEQKRRNFEAEED